MKVFKAILKIVGIVTAIAAACAAVYLVVKKLQEQQEPDGEGKVESFVSCSCLDDEPIVVEE